MSEPAGPTICLWPTPNDPTGRRVLMVDNGSNVAPPAPALAYTIENRESGPRIEWSNDPVTSIIAQSFKPARLAQFDHDERVAGHRECDDWLRAFLTSGHRSPAEIFRAAHDAGYTKNRIRRAKSRIGVTVIKQGFATRGQWVWLLSGPTSHG